MGTMLVPWTLGCRLSGKMATDTGRFKLPENTV